MIRAFLSCFSFIIATSAFGEMPPYFNKEIDSEYRELLKHVNEMLPKTDIQLAYLPSFFPYNLLDVRPTHFVKNNDKQAFANFNFGVFGSRLLNINKKQLANLPIISICKEQICKEERIERIKKFLVDSQLEVEGLRQSTNIYIVQQTTSHVFRINNTFYSPTQLITYFPSEQAGFIPSGDYKLSKPGVASELMALSEVTKPLRKVMAEYNVAAITKINEESFNIIFGGISDNHWGVVINHHSTIPTSGDYSHIGLEYDIVQKVSDSSFYYQTN